MFSQVDLLLTVKKEEIIGFMEITVGSLYCFRRTDYCKVRLNASGGVAAAAAV